MSIELLREDDVYLMSCDAADCDIEHIEPRRIDDDVSKARARFAACHGAEQRTQGGACFDICGNCAWREQRAKALRGSVAHFSKLFAARKQSARVEQQFGRDQTIRV